MNAKDPITIELSLKERIDEYGRALYAERLQRLADETPRIGSDGTMLSEGRTQTAMFLTPYGKVELNVFCGRCRQTGRFEAPFKTRYCRGRRSAMTPLLEHRIATTSCETGSYEKCARVCKAAWLSQRCHELKHSGPSNLIKAISEIELKSIRRRESKKIVKREAAYFRNHVEHMHYERNGAHGVPIGSGAMESQCSQNQNRFKRRGQFWSDEGFSLAIKVYVRYFNDELDYCYAKAS